MIFMSSLLQTYLYQFGISPTNVKVHLSDCFVTSLQHQREFVLHQLAWHFPCLYKHLFWINKCYWLFMYRNVVTEMFPDRKVTYPSEILINYLIQIWNPVRCCTVPRQNWSDNNDD